MADQAQPLAEARGEGAIGAVVAVQAAAGGGLRRAPRRGTSGRCRTAAVPTGAAAPRIASGIAAFPMPPNAAATFTRRANTNYMQTGVLSALQLASMFPNLVLENFYVKTRNSIEEGKTKAPYGFVIPGAARHDAGAELVRILRLQGIEVGQATAAVKIGDATYPRRLLRHQARPAVWRLAKNLLEKQQYPDAALRTYDDSGWSMGLAMNVDVVEIADSPILKANAPPVTPTSCEGHASPAPAPRAWRWRTSVRTT